MNDFVVLFFAAAAEGVEAAFSIIMIIQALGNIVVVFLHPLVDAYRTTKQLSLTSTFSSQFSAETVYLSKDPE